MENTMKSYYSTCFQIGSPFFSLMSRGLSETLVGCCRSPWAISNTHISLVWRHWQHLKWMTPSGLSLSQGTESRSFTQLRPSILSIGNKVRITNPAVRRKPDLIRNRTGGFAFRRMFDCLVFYETHFIRCGCLILQHNGLFSKSLPHAWVPSSWSQNFPGAPVSLWYANN